MNLTDIDNIILFVENEGIELFDKTIFVQGSEILNEFIAAHISVNPGSLVNPTWQRRCAKEVWPCFVLSGYNFIVVDHFNPDSFWLPLKRMIHDDWDLAQVITYKGIHKSVFEKTNKFQIKLILQLTEWVPLPEKS